MTIVRKALVRAVLWTAGLGLGLVLMRHQPGSITMVAPHGGTDLLAQHVQHLMSVHRCWNGPAPAGVTLPGHAVVGLHGDVFYGHRWVGPALDHVFKGSHKGLTVYGFCR